MKCPDCGGTVVRDATTGELVCSRCGLVVGEVEYVPRFVPRTVERGSFAYAGLPATGKPTRRELVKYRDRYLYMIGRTESRERIAANIATYVSLLAGRMGMNLKVVEEEAMRLAKLLLKQMREKGRRLNADEIAAVSLWQACKVHGFPITMREFEDACATAFRWERGGSLLKLISKAREVGLAEDGRWFEPNDYLRRLVARLRGLGLDGLDERYIDALAAYAMQLCDAVRDSNELRGKNPVCVAAAAMCVADELMGGWVGHERMKGALGVGFGKEAYRLMKEKAPPVHASLWDRVLSGLEERVKEVSYSAAKAGSLKLEVV